MHWHTRWIICSFVGLLANSLLAQSTEFMDGQHIFANTGLIFGCQIASLEAELNDEAKQDVQEIHEFLNDLTGVDTRGLTEIILQFGDDDYRFASAADVISPTIGIVFRCQEEIPKDTIEKFVTKLNLREDKYDGHAYFMRPGIEPAFVFSENSMLIAEKERIFKYLDQLRTDGDAADSSILQHTLVGSEITGHISLEQTGVSRLLKSLITEFEPAGLNYPKTLEPIIKHAKSANLQVALNETKVIQITLQIRKQSDLASLEMEVKKLFALILAQLEATKTLAKLANQPDYEGLLKSFITVFSGMKISQTDEGVLISSENSQAVRDVLNQYIRYLHGLLKPSP